MEKSEYEAWWQLHLRVAQGEILGSEEQIRYQQGLLELESAEEAVDHELVAQLQQLRTRLDELNRENTVLHEKSDRLDHEIAELEAAYQMLTGQPLLPATYAAR